MKTKTQNVMKIYISQNIKYLANKKGQSYNAFGATFGLKKNRINAYINEGTRPPIEVLVQIAEYYHITLDTLVLVDLQAHPERLEAKDDTAHAMLRTMAPKMISEYIFEHSDDFLEDQTFRMLIRSLKAEAASKHAEVDMEDLLDTMHKLLTKLSEKE